MMGTLEKYYNMLVNKVSDFKKNNSYGVVVDVIGLSLLGISALCLFSILFIALEPMLFGLVFASAGYFLLKV